MDGIHLECVVVESVFMYFLEGLQRLDYLVRISRVLVRSILARAWLFLYILAICDQTSWHAVTFRLKICNARHAEPKTASSNIRLCSTHIPPFDHKNFFFVIVIYFLLDFFFYHIATIFCHVLKYILLRTIIGLNLILTVTTRKLCLTSSINIICMEVLTFGNKTS